MQFISIPDALPFLFVYRDPKGNLHTEFKHRKTQESQYITRIKNAKCSRAATPKNVIYVEDSKDTDILQFSIAVPSNYQITDVISIVNPALYFFYTEPKKSVRYTTFFNYPTHQDTLILFTLGTTQRYAKVFSDNDNYFRLDGDKLYLLVDDQKVPIDLSLAYL